jgi:DNA-binding CsgD family transcriptional regulator
LIGAGLGTARIAQELGLSRKTIESYREHIKLKLGFSNAEALRKGALEWVHHSPAESPGARKNRGNPR